MLVPLLAGGRGALTFAVGASFLRWCLIRVGVRRPWACRASGGVSGAIDCTASCGACNYLATHIIEEGCCTMVASYVTGVTGGDQGAGYWFGRFTVWTVSGPLSWVV